MKKRILSIIFAAIVGFSLSATAVAAELENESAETSAETNTESSTNIESESSTEDGVESETEVTEETETSCTEICHINISYEQEYYVIENLCPTGEVETMNLAAEFSVEKGNELQLDLDEVSPEVQNIIKEVDELSVEIENSYEISAKVSAEGIVTINSVSASDAESVSCEVIVMTEKEKFENELDEENPDDNSNYNKLEEDVSENTSASTVFPAEDDFDKITSDTNSNQKETATESVNTESDCRDDSEE